MKSLIKKFFSLYIISFFIVNIFGGVNLVQGQIAFNRVYGSIDTTQFVGPIAQTADNCYVTGGNSTYWVPNISQWVDKAFITKYDANGNILWRNNTMFLESYESIYPLADSGFAFAAYHGLVNTFGKVLMVIGRCDKNGDNIWEYNYGQSYDYSCNSIVQAKDGGFVVTGSKYDYPKENLILIKTNSKGVEIFKKEYTLKLASCGISVVQTSDGGYFICGYNSNNGAYGLYALKVNYAGVIKWEKNYGGINEGYGTAGIQTLDGGYLITGGKTMKLDVNGDSVWSVPVNGVSCMQNADSTYTIGGLTTDSPYKDMKLVKLDKDGSKLWEHKYGNKYNESGGYTIKTSDGGYAIVGRSATPTNSFDQIRLVKTGPEGIAYGLAVPQSPMQQEHFTIYPNPANDGIFNIQFNEPYIGTLQLYNMQMQLVKTINVKGLDLYNVNCEGLAKGMYILKGNNINSKVILY